MNDPSIQLPNSEQTSLVVPTPSSQNTWHASRGIPFRLAITIPLACMKLRDLHALIPGTVLHTGISAADDVPVRVGGVMLGWGELDNVDGQMAVRLTRLA